MIPLNEIPANTISVSWINSSGCPQTADTIITTIPPNIKVPNAFTPNGDELNDLFRPKNDSSAELIEFLVYNRWGQLVFEGDNADGWDGTFDGEAAPAEVYVYVMKFRFPNGNVETRKGDVTLIR
jgi:gliding motility-associated-like protein